jgi:hypothetical protein
MHSVCPPVSALRLLKQLAKFHVTCYEMTSYSWLRNCTSDFLHSATINVALDDLLWVLGLMRGGERDCV